MKKPTNGCSFCGKNNPCQKPWCSFTEKKEMKQAHDVRIIFEGTFADLEEFLNYKKIKTEFIPPGLKGSQGILTIDKEEMVKIPEGEEFAPITKRQLLAMYKGLAKEAYIAKSAGDMWEGEPNGYRDWLERLFK